MTFTACRKSSGNLTICGQSGGLIQKCACRSFQQPIRHAFQVSAKCTSARGCPNQAAASERHSWDWTKSWDAKQAHFVLLGVLATGSIPAVQAFEGSAMLYLLSLAMCTIYIGSHKALTAPYYQQLSLKEGILAPVWASAVLFGIYLLISYFPDNSLQLLIDLYIFVLASFTVSEEARVFLNAIPALRVNVFKGRIPAWLLVEKGEEEGQTSMQEFRLTAVDVAGGLLGLGIALADLLGHHSNFTLNNLVATSVAIVALQQVGLRSFKTAAVLLLGLVAYDVFWVFGSSHVLPSGDNVMFKVATSDAFVIPSKLLFPRAAFNAVDAQTYPYNLLGLGDVVLPGLLATLALRFDASRCVDMRARASAAIDAIDDAMRGLPKDADRSSMGQAAADAALQAYDRVADADDAQRDASMDGSADAVLALQPVTDAVMAQRRYFIWVMWAYLLALLATFGVNAFTNAGQPALLYLSPGTLGAVALLAAIRGETERVWGFTAVKPKQLRNSSMPKDL